MNRTCSTVSAALALMCITISPQSHANNNGPASAINWLTESLSAPEMPVDQNNQSSSTVIEPISVERLDDTSYDNIGILRPDVTGFPVSLWKGMDADELLDRIRQLPYDGVPQNKSLFRQLLLAESEPPSGDFVAGRIVTARVDKLLSIGALSEAQALIETTGADTPELFRRWFDIGLLTNRAEDACDKLSATPTLSASRAVQIYCLALSGDWDAAATSLALGEDLGEITTREADLLSFFLDESLLEEMDPPVVGDPLTSLEFVIRESVGLPRPTSGLPIAFMHAELPDYVPLRFRIEASEALVKQGVLPASVLFAAYREEVPAASGGVWERVAATQTMDAAATAEEISDAFFKLDTEVTKVGLRQAAAQEFLLYISELPPAEFDDETRDLATVYLLLAGAYEFANLWQSDGAPDELRIATSIATGRYDQGSNIENSLSSSTPEALLTEHHSNLISNGQVGEALIDAVAMIARGDAADSGDLIEALSLLRAAGQDQAATSIAVETLLLDLEIARANEPD